MPGFLLFYWIASALRAAARDRGWPRAIDGAPDHLPDLAVGQEQIVVETAAGIFGRIDDANAERLELSLFGDPDAGDASRHVAHRAERAVVGHGQNGDVARKAAKPRNRRCEAVHVDIGRCQNDGAETVRHRCTAPVVELPQRFHRHHRAHRMRDNMDGADRQAPGPVDRASPPSRHATTRRFRGRRCSSAWSSSTATRTASSRRRI